VQWPEVHISWWLLLLKVKPVTRIRFGSYSPDITGYMGGGITMGGGVIRTWLVRTAELTIHPDWMLSYKYAGKQIDPQKSCTIVERIEGTGAFSVDQKGFVMINYKDGFSEVQNTCDPSKNERVPATKQQRYFERIDVKVEPGRRRLRLIPIGDTRGMNFVPVTQVSSR
jgi:hypothetical protein